MMLPPAPARYTPEDEAQTRRQLAEADRQNAKKAQITVTGSRASGAALVSLLAALEQTGLIVDTTTA